MELIFDEDMIRAELRRLDKKTGLHAADLPIKFGNARTTLGRFSYVSEDNLQFYFSNYYFQNPKHPVEEKLNTIRHEYAHYMDYMLNGSSSHGPLWKKCCGIVGAFPVTYYSEARSNAFMAKHEKENLLKERYAAYDIGCVIDHPVFGKGRIMNIKGEGLHKIAYVSFESGEEKKIAINWIDLNCKKLSQCE